MTKYIALIALVLFSACAHPRFESWKGKEFTVSCNRSCSEKDWDMMVKKACMGNATKIGEGSYTRLTGIDYTTVGYSTISTPTKSRRATATYLCDSSIHPF